MALDRNRRGLRCRWITEAPTREYGISLRWELVLGAVPDCCVDLGYLWLHHVEGDYASPGRQISMTTEDKRISPEDIRNKLNEITGSVGDELESTKGTAITVGAIALGVLVVAVFLIGRRRGKRLATIVEIRRV